MREGCTQNLTAMALMRNQLGGREGTELWGNIREGTPSNTSRGPNTESLLEAMYSEQEERVS